MASSHSWIMVVRVTSELCQPASYRATTSGDWRCAVLSSSSPAITLDRTTEALPVPVQYGVYYVLRHQSYCSRCVGVNVTTGAGATTAPVTVGSWP
uniref:Uncharacterized protein n=1 Tax=Oryza nivara TaxID=4536 RepID=A0A0E0GCK0_ORYNI